jgi:hypothetical protein
MARAGVNFARCATVVAFAASAFALMASASASVRLVAHNQNGTVTWNLVNTPCTPGGSIGSITLSSQAVPAGRGCYDPAGALFQSDWQVNEGSATWDVPGRWSAQYSYSVPDTVPAGGASLPMSIDLQELAGSSSGFHEQYCVLAGTYMTILQSDPCARAGTDVANGTASGSATLTLDTGSNAPSGTANIVTIGFGDGGHLYFDYQARAASRTTYHYTMEASGVGNHAADTYTGHGTFQIASGDTGSALVFVPHGSMTAVIHGTHGAHTILLKLTRATFDPNLQSPFGVLSELEAVFRVTASTRTCAPVGRQVQFDLEFSQDHPGHGLFEGDLCSRHGLDTHAKMTLSHS